MLVTDPIIASNYDSYAYMVLVVGRALFFGVLPTLLVSLLRVLIWIRSLRDMPESWPKLLAMWFSGTVSAYLCLGLDLWPPNVPEWIWNTPIVLTMILITYTLWQIRLNRQLNTWKVWAWGIILPGMILSPASMFVFGD